MSKGLRRQHELAPTGQRRYNTRTSKKIIGMDQTYQICFNQWVHNDGKNQQADKQADKQTASHQWRMLGNQQRTQDFS